MIRNVTLSACGSPGSVSTARQLVRPDGWIGADAVPGGEAEQQHADQRDQAEGDEERKRRQRQPARATAAAAPREARRRGLRRGGATRGHLPMIAFMLSANCWGEIDIWNSLAMLSSSASAAVGLSAWSHDCAKTLALLETS